MNFGVLVVEAQTDWCYRFELESDTTGFVIIKGTVGASGLDTEFYTFSGGGASGVEVTFSLGAYSNFEQVRVVGSFTPTDYDNTTYGIRVTDLPKSQGNGQLIVVNDRPDPYDIDWTETGINTWDGVRIIANSGSTVNLPLETVGGYIDFIEFEGTGANPLGTTNCGSFSTPTPMPTNTPVNTNTPLPSATATEFGGGEYTFSLVCPDALVNSEDVNSRYGGECIHCLDISSAPTSTFPTATIDPAVPTSIYPTATEIVRVSDVATPVPTVFNPTATPGASVESCSLSSGCSWIADIFGTNGGSVDLMAVISGQDARLAGVRVDVGMSGNFPRNVDEIILDYTISSSYGANNAYYTLRDRNGVFISSSWVSEFDSSFTISSSILDAESFAVRYVDLVIASDIGAYAGSITLDDIYLYTFDWDEWDDGPVYGSSGMFDDVVCSLPQNYPPSATVNSPEEFIGFTLATIPTVPECFTLWQGFDATSLVSNLSQFFGGTSVENAGIPQVEICVLWVALPEMVLFTIPIPIATIISGMVAIAFIGAMKRL